jgi:hypothetical protein
MGNQPRRKEMQNEQAVKLTAKLYKYRDTAKSIFGDQYYNRMAAYGQTVKSTANALGCNELSAATTLAKKASSEIAALCYLASVVEMTEPSNQA